MFLLGVLLSALFQRYVPADKFAALFGENHEFRRAENRPRRETVFAVSRLCNGVFFGDGGACKSDNLKLETVAAPQLFHALGAVSGLGTSLGEVFLPMHLPIILVGPLCSFAISGMPSAVMLPFMMIELCVYGLTAGILRNVKLPTIVKVVIAQIAGRAVRAGAILLAVNVFGSQVKVSTIWTSIGTGLFGLALQWALLPLIVYHVENLKKNDN